MYYIAKAWNTGHYNTLNDADEHGAIYYIGSSHKLSEVTVMVEAAYRAARMVQDDVGIEFHIRAIVGEDDE